MNTNTKSTQFTPKAGDDVYGLHGHQGEYISALPHEGHIVRPQYENHDGEPHLGDPVLWAQVFPKPPVEKLHAEVTALLKQQEDAYAEIRKIREEKTALERDYKARMAKLQRHEKLKRLEDFLDGKLTHYALFPCWGSPRVILMSDAKCGSDQWTKDTKLLTLFGNTKGEIAWMLNQYRDGSGSNYEEVLPCGSEEEAIDAIRQRAKAVFAAWAVEQKGGDAGHFAEVAEKFGFEVPPEFIAWRKEKDIAAAEQRVATAKSAYAKEVSTLNELRKV